MSEYLIQVLVDENHSEENSSSLFVRVLNEDAHAVFMGCSGRELILCLSVYQGRVFLTVPSHCDENISSFSRF